MCATHTHTHTHTHTEREREREEYTVGVVEGVIAVYRNEFMTLRDQKCIR